MSDPAKTTSSAAAPAFTTSEKWVTFGAVLLVFFLAALDQTIVATAMPRIIEQLHGIELYAWVSTAYMLTSTVMVPIYGRLGDAYGRKPVLLAGVAIFLAGSVLCGLSGELGALPGLESGMTQLIAFRALQGIGGAAFFTSAFAIMADIFSPRERARYGGLLGAVFGISSILGPVVGGFLTDLGSVRLAGYEIAGWRLIFYINVPLGLLSLFVIVFKMPRLPVGAPGPIDYAGAAFFIAAVTPLLLALTWGGREYPWASIEIGALMASAVISLMAFIAVQRRVRHPILPLELFRNRVFSTCNVTGFFSGVALIGIVMFMPLFMQVVLGVSATSSGTTIIPLSFGLILSATICGLIISRIGRYKLFLVGSMLMLIACIASLTQIGPHSTLDDVQLRLFLTGIALGPPQSVFIIAIQASVPSAVLGVATGAGQFFRQVGAVMGVALLGTVLTHTLARELPRALPDVPGMQDGGLDLSTAQTSAMNPDSIRSAITDRANEQFEVIAQAYRGDEQARTRVLGSALLPETVKAPLRTATGPVHNAETTIELYRQFMTEEVEAVVGRIRAAIKAAFAVAITELLQVCLWVVVAAFITAIFIPSIPLLDTGRGARGG